MRALGYAPYNANFMCGLGTEKNKNRPSGYVDMWDRKLQKMPYLEHLTFYGQIPSIETNANGGGGAEPNGSHIRSPIYVRSAHKGGKLGPLKRILHIASVNTED